MLPEEVEYIVWHCSATRRGSRLTFDNCVKMHTEERGFFDIGYHLYHEIDGSIKQGRDFGTTGAHVKGFNYKSIGVCYEGGLDEEGNPCDTRNEKQKQSMLTTYMFLSSMFPNAEHVGHRDLSPDLDGDGVVEEHEWLKSCPCFDVKSEYK